MLRVRGKGSKQRLIPVGDPALEAVAAYLAAGRAELGRRGTSPALFLNQRGGRLSRVTVWNLVKRCAAAAGWKPQQGPTRRPLPDRSAIGTGRRTARSSRRGPMAPNARGCASG